MVVKGVFFYMVAGWVVWREREMGGGVDCFFSFFSKRKKFLIFGILEFYVDVRTELA